MKKIIITLTALCAMCRCLPQTNGNKYTLVITNANIVDVANNTIIPHRLIAISGTTIAAVDDTRKARAYKANKYVDAMNKYVLPGLWDMHVHLRGGDTLIDANKKLLRLFLAYGVTTVRECGGDIADTVLGWKRQIVQGTLAGPRIFTCGPKIDGPGAFWPGSLEVETPGQVSKALDSLQRMHVDFVKLYDSKISRNAYLEAIEQAHKRGMKITGHMPYTAELAEAVQRGMNGSEHMFYIFKACSAKEDSLTKLIQEREHTDKPVGIFAALPALYNTYDETKATALFQLLAQKKFTITPTLFVQKTVVVNLKDQDHSSDTTLAYIDPKIRATYQGRVKNASTYTDERVQFLKKFMTKTQSMIPGMYNAGMNLLAGSDCGAFNSYIYPGESLHEEVKLLVASGLTPAEALETATINGAKFMGVGDFYGSIQKGKCSDMDILDGNPLADITAIDHINMVVSHGKLYSRSDLDNLLRSIKN